MGRARNDGAEPRLDLRVLGFTLGLSFLTGIIFGILPALRATNLDLTPCAERQRTQLSGLGRSWLSKSLVVVQVSLSVLLLIGAGLLIRTLEIFNTSTRDSTQTICCSSTWCRASSDTRIKSSPICISVNCVLEAVPGVQSVTFSRSPLLSQRSWTGSVYVPGEIGSDGQPRESDADALRP